MRRAGPGGGKSVRRPAVAGLFYPSDPATLGRMISGLLAENQKPLSPPPQGVLEGLVVPHAGYVYSGPIAATAFNLLGSRVSRFRRVVILGPSHRVAFAGVAAPEAAFFETPLGKVPVDRPALAGLEAQPGFVYNDTAHALEHSLEVQLPFLQTLLTGFSVVPLVVGDADPQTVCGLVEKLWPREDTLMVVSTDLSHYLAYEDARRVDGNTVTKILHFKTPIVPEEACGGRPLSGFLRAAGARKLTVRLLDQRNSGDTSGERDRVVGYAALGFWDTHGAGT